MSEIPRLRIPRTTASSTSSGGPHFAVSAFEQQVQAVDPVLPPRAVAVGSGLNELSAEPETFATAQSAPVELAAVGLKKNYRKGSVEIPTTYTNAFAAAANKLEGYAK